MSERCRLIKQCNTYIPAAAAMVSVFSNACTVTIETFARTLQKDNPVPPVIRPRNFTLKLRGTAIRETRPACVCVCVCVCVVCVCVCVCVCVRVRVQRTLCWVKPCVADRKLVWKCRGEVKERRNRRNRQERVTNACNPRCGHLSGNAKVIWVERSEPLLDHSARRNI